MLRGDSNESPFFVKERKDNMPTYRFKDKDSKDEFDLAMKMSELDKYKTDNPHLEQIVNNIRIGDPILLGITRTSDSMNSLLRNAKKKNLGSNISCR